MNSQRVGKERIYHAHSSPGHLSQIEDGQNDSPSSPLVPGTPEIGRIVLNREKSRSLNSRPRTQAIKNDFPLAQSASSFPPLPLPHPNNDSSADNE